MQLVSRALRCARRTTPAIAAGVASTAGRMLVAAALAMCGLGSASARAQAPSTVPDARHTVIGSVRAADESRLVGAHVQLNRPGRTGAPAIVVITEADGVFRFEHVPEGSAALVVRRLGFRPETLSVEVPQLEGGPVVVALERVAQQIAPVTVRGTRHAARLASAFERRRASGLGRYITREEIERRNPQRTTDLLRDLAGVTVTGSGPRFRGAGSASCSPVYFLDGMPVGAGTLDLDAISPKSIEAIEVYSGAATVPAALRTAMSPGGCGAVVLWSRQGSTPRDLLGAVGAVDSLEDIVSRGLAYTADQVELAAAPLPGLGPVPAYPDSLLAAGARGRVVAEFIVDGQGHVDAETVGIVSSSHPLFAEAVRAAVIDARFSPAYREGHVVRQVVHLPVDFDPRGPTAAPAPR